VATITIKKEFTRQVIRSTARYFRERQHGPGWTCIHPTKIYKKTL